MHQNSAWGTFKNRHVPNDEVRLLLFFQLFGISRYTLFAVKMKGLRRDFFRRRNISIPLSQRLMR